MRGNLYAKLLATNKTDRAIAALEVMVQHRFRHRPDVNPRRGWSRSRARATMVWVAKYDREETRHLVHALRVLRQSKTVRG
jgi:hypothetical protein